ncbi:MAG: helix-turn-helix domain-containing protein [Clostridia bacterium]|nr:helix-turn-helix domain-containing protein [Clostridia bacterium]
MKDRYLTVSEVAELLKVSYDTALNFVKDKVEYVTVGRQYRVLESKLNEVLYPSKSVKKKLKQRPVYQIVERR